MKSDTEIERDVREELEWHPDLDATDVAVSVKSGVVTLAGFVKSYSEKYQAEAAAKRVSGVAGVANDLEVRIPSVDERSDPEIARDAVSAIKSQLPFSWDRVKVLVKNGWVTLEGIVAWQYQKTAAENAVRGIKGVRGISNLIALRPTTQASEIKTKILEAFRRNAEVDAKRIQVEANGSEVVLKGTVRSWIERAEAERIAWSAPGVTKVEDRIRGKLVLGGHLEAYARQINCVTPRATASTNPAGDRRLRAKAPHSVCSAVQVFRSGKRPDWVGCCQARGRSACKAQR